MKQRLLGKQGLTVSAEGLGCMGMSNVYGAADEENVRDSDAICTALQLINFLQDVAVDLHKERIYIPLEDLNRYAISPAALDHASARPRWRSLMRFEVDRARKLMLSGAPLALRLPGRIGFELRMVVQGGLRILDAIEAAEYDVFCTVRNSPAATGSASSGPPSA